MVSPHSVSSHQGGLSLGWYLRTVSSEWSFIMVVSVRVVFYQGGLSSEWSFIRMVSHESGLFTFIYIYIFFLSRWSFDSVFLSGKSSIRVVSHQGGLLSQ